MLPTWYEKYFVSVSFSFFQVHGSGIFGVRRHVFCFLGVMYSVFSNSFFQECTEYICL